MRPLLCAAAIAILIPCVFPNRTWSETKRTSVTVYSSADQASFDPQIFIADQRSHAGTQWISEVPGFGVVREERDIALKSGMNEVKFSDVAQHIDPTTVSFADLTDSKTFVLEQLFKFDLASAGKILERFIDNEITAVVPMGQSLDEVRGTLLSVGEGSYVVQTPEGVRIVRSGNEQIKLGGLPGGLITKPTLVWKIKSAQEGVHRVRTSYQTGGITWRSDYTVLLSENEKSADISAWVTILNLCGTSFVNTALKLVAGDVNLIPKQQKMLPRSQAFQAAAMELGDTAGFKEKSFFEYHLYTLPRPVDIPQNATQQLTLFPTASNVAVEKVLLYYGAPAGMWWPMGDPATDRSFGSQMNTKVDVFVQFKNEESNAMGMPLPRGRVRVYKLDNDDGGLEFIGEDLIDHTPRDEMVRVKLGQAFDVVGSRVQTDFASDTSRKEISESFRITLKNHKDKPQSVIIKENLYRWSTWEITAKSDSYEKIDSRTVHFPVEVPARGQKEVTYSVRYRW